MATTDNLNFNELPFTNVSLPVAVDYDPTENTVYWTDVGHGTLNSAVIDGSNQRILVQNLSGQYQLYEEITENLEFVTCSQVLRLFM